MLADYNSEDEAEESRVMLFTDFVDSEMSGTVQGKGANEVIESIHKLLTSSPARSSRSVSPVPSPVAATRTTGLMSASERVVAAKAGFQRILGEELFAEVYTFLTRVRNGCDEFNDATIKYAMLLLVLVFYVRVQVCYRVFVHGVCGCTCC